MEFRIRNMFLELSLLLESGMEVFLLSKSVMEFFLILDSEFEIDFPFFGVQNMEYPLYNAMFVKDSDSSYSGDLSEPCITNSCNRTLQVLLPDLCSQLASSCCCPFRSLP